MRHFKEGVLRACYYLCGEKDRRSKGDLLRWNVEVKVAIARKKDAHKAMYLNCVEENKKWYKCMKNTAKKAVSKAMREKV